ncbi:DUF3750 domain-containing protein [Nitrosomonas marina]|uniref:DUF3750 domain-containing protein n=1 Tax=Nitrosomonas marina TaxID=917 RepID=A0A1H8D7S4_9PROT|nr:DUF3750 domain-containing protein [Nitrosomonas marina]SEN02527.1 Protein of unknown function [Nitrosomonas marina]
MRRFQFDNRWLIAAAFSVLMCVMVVSYDARGNWRTASRASIGIAPDPVSIREAVVQVYGARAYSWRGYFGIHTWIAVKPTNAESFTIYEVLGWRQRRQLPVLAIYDQQPDRRWFGNAPEIFADKRGDGVDALIERIEQAVESYPYTRQYTLWPGPNSNTFTAWIARAVPELELSLPATAIGKDYLGYRLFATPPSGSGFQFSLFGLLGFIISSIEGVELNFLGLTFGINFDPFAVKLPIVGDIQLPSQHTIDMPEMS